MARSSLLRASDADRDAVAERLRQASIEGRLEPHELEERLHAALRARTYGELDRLLSDLPARRPATWGRRSGAVPTARLAVVVAARALVLLAILAAVLVAVAMAATWWLIGLVVWLVVRAGHGSCSRHTRRRSTWHHAPRARRV